MKPTDLAPPASRRAKRLLTLLTVINGACSSAPATPDPGPQAGAAATARPAASCAELQAAIRDTQAASDEARERKANAWKLVVPFAVLARHAQAGSALDAAEQQLATLRTQAGTQGCT